MQKYNGRQKLEEVTGLMSSELINLNVEENSEILRWTCRVREAADKHICVMQFFLFMIGTVLVCIFLNGLWDDLPKNIEYFYIFCPVIYLVMGGFCLIVRQKTVFNYSISFERGVCESYLYFPSWAGTLFNGVAITVILIFLIATVIMGTLIPLIGAGVLGLGYAGRLLSWENKVETEQSAPWGEYRFITLDHKRKIIVAHWDDITMGFELRCHTQERFDEFWVFLKNVLRPDVEVLHRRWDAADAYSLNI